MQSLVATAAMLGDFDKAPLFEVGRGVIVVEWLLPGLYFLYLAAVLIVLLNLLIAAMSAVSRVDEPASVWSWVRVSV